MRKPPLDYALNLIFRSAEWRDLVRQIKGNEITDGAGEDVAAYIREQVSDQLTAAVTGAKKAASGD